MVHIKDITHIEIGSAHNVQSQTFETEVVMIDLGFSQLTCWSFDVIGAQPDKEKSSLR